jgi:hypothetical protein
MDPENGSERGSDYIPEPEVLERDYSKTLSLFKVLTPEEYDELVCVEEKKEQSRQSS